MRLIKAMWLVIALFLCSCNDNNPGYIINQTIQHHGGDAYNSAFIGFEFRNRRYESRREDGLFTYKRFSTDSTGNFRDELSNEGFKRYQDNLEIEVNEEWTRKYSNSVNSVIYFALLPYGLNDPAVNKKYIGQESIHQHNYHLIQITFDEDGGGEDFEDVFYYWINTKNNQVDYLAYTYDTEEKGVRFRQATNPRRVEGILFQDYINFKPEQLVPLDSLSSLFVQNKLVELSRINLENISVNLLDQ